MGRPMNLHKFGGALSVTGVAVDGNQLKVKAFINGSAVDAGLKQQKKQRSFVAVSNAGLTATCTFVDKSSGAALAEGEMFLRVTPASGPAFSAKKITNRYVWDFAGHRYMWSFNTTTGKVVATAE
jgi:hypothetical protein